MITEWGGAHILQAALMPSKDKIADWHLALCWASPTTQATGDTLPELAFARNYARARMPATTFIYQGGVLINNTTVEFNSNSDPKDWRAASYFAICDAAQGGNVLAWERLLAPLVVASGLAPYFRPGGIQIVLGN